MSEHAWISDAWRDVRQAVRALIARPTYTLGVLLSLALGIGANAMIYSIVNAVMIHAYSYPDADRLLTLYEVRQNTPHAKLTPGSVGRIAEQASIFEAMGAASGWPVPSALTTGGRAQMVDGTAVTAGLFPALEVTPLLGRLFRPEDSQLGRPHVVILRERMWRQTFGADAHIVGRVISLDNAPYTVIGVIRDADAYPVGTRDLWVPYPAADLATNFGSGNMVAVGRLAIGTTQAQAQAQVNTIATQISKEHPNSWANASVQLTNLRGDELRDVRPIMLTLEATVVLVLLIACANTANLQLGRVIGRERELAVRVSLGARRWRIARMLLTESVILALVGGTLGALLAAFSVPLIRDHILAAYLTQGVAGWSDIAVNGQVLLFTAIVSIITGVLFGTGPALHAARVDLTSSLKEGGRGATAGAAGSRFRNALVVSQFALALVLTIGAVLMTRSFAALLHTSPGFQSEHVVTLPIGIPKGRYARDSAVKQVAAQLVDRMGTIPGVRATALTSFLPLTHSYNGTQLALEGAAPAANRDMQWALEQAVTADYFNVLGIRLMRGRLWAPRTTGDSTRFVVVNQALVDKLLPGRDPIGVVLKLGWGSAPISGVVSNTKSGQLESDEPELHVYEPMETQAWRQYNLLVRVAGDPGASVDRIRHEVATLDPDIAVGPARTMDTVVADYLSPWLFMAALIGSFALIAIVIAGVGIYGVVSYSVSQRTHEFGIRMALGAHTGDVIRLVMRQVLGPMLIALPIALLGAWAIARLMSSLLYGVSARDVATYVTVTTVLLAIAAMACLIPARRVAALPPSESLRDE